MKFVILLLLSVFSMAAPRQQANPAHSGTVLLSATAYAMGDSIQSHVKLMSIDQANKAVVAKAKETLNLLRSKDDSISYLSNLISQRADTLRARISAINQANSHKSLSYEKTRNQ